MLRKINQLSQQHKINVKPGKPLARCHISVAHCKRRWKAIPHDFYPFQSHIQFWRGGSSPCHAIHASLLLQCCSWTRCTVGSSSCLSEDEIRSNLDRIWLLLQSETRNLERSHFESLIPGWAANTGSLCIRCWSLFVLILKPSIFDA